MLTLVSCGENSTPELSDGVFAFVANDDTLEATSLLQKPLYRSSIGADARAKMVSQAEDARQQWLKYPNAVDSYVWYGRRLAYLGRYRDAIEVYTKGLEIFPGEPHLLRHRGHRYVTTRNLDAAIADFEKAAETTSGQPDEVEPDGQPNAAGIPTSTLQTNIWYHLGLAYYLKGHFDDAVQAFQVCFDLAENNDMRVAAADWLYMSLRRAGWHDEANRAIEFVSSDLEVIENDSYLQRLLMYRGLSEDAGLGDAVAENSDDIALATLGYGVGNWYLLEGSEERAHEVFQNVLNTGSWAAFGFIASESEIARVTE